METTFAGKYQQNRVTNNAADLIELLAALAIGVFGMFLAELGEGLNNPIIYWSGIVASVSAAGYITVKFLYITVKFLRELKDYINSFKKKDTTDTSK